MRFAFSDEKRKPSHDQGTAAEWFGDLSAQASPDTGATSSTLDAAGNVLTRTDARGATATYTYGRLTRVTDTAGVTSWSYEAQGRPNNRVSGITVNGSTLISAAIPEPFGPFSAWHWGNGLYSFRDVDGDGRVAAWEFRNGSSILRNNITHDVASRISQVADPANASLGSTYQYDALDRLTLAQKGSPVTSTRQYTYDAVGNRMSSQIDSAVVTSEYASTSNRLQVIAGGVDANYLNGATSLTFSYNNANRLASVQLGATAIASYLVNALGQRVQKTVGTSNVRFVYDEAGHLLGEYDSAGNLIQETVWLEDMPIATLRPTGTGTPTPIAIYYVHPDHLGTPRAITRPSDNVFMWRWDNTDPFGVNMPNENPASQGTFTYSLRFPGQYYDAELGTHYNYFRDYDPSIGRYAQSDPIGLDGGINTYGYVEGNPLSRTDPTGESWAPARGAWWIGTRIGGGINYGINAATGLSLGVIIYDACHREVTDGRSPLDRCLDAAAAGGPVWDNLCRSLKNPIQRKACWARGPETENNKRGWCFRVFGK